MTKPHITDYSGLQNITYYNFTGWGDTLPPADTCSLILSAECWGIFNYHQDIRCKLKRDTEAKGTTFIKNKVGFNLLTYRVIKYWVLVSSNTVWWSLMTESLHITVEHSVVWMQPWMSCCQHSGMLRKPILCHVCKHIVKFLAASNAQYLCRSAAEPPAINLMSLGQIRYTVCTLNTEFVCAQQILHAESRWNSCQWDGHLYRTASPIPPWKILN